MTEYYHIHVGVGLEVEKTISISAMEAAALTCKLQNSLKPSISSAMAVSFLSPLHLSVTSTTLFSQRRFISYTLRTQPSPPPASTSLTQPPPTSLVLNPNNIPNSSSPDSSPPISCALQCPHFQSYVLYSTPSLLQFQLCYISFFFCWNFELFLSCWLVARVVRTNMTFTVQALLMRLLTSLAILVSPILHLIVADWYVINFLMQFFFNV